MLYKQYRADIQTRTLTYYVFSSYIYFILLAKLRLKMTSAFIDTSDNNLASLEVNYFSFVSLRTNLGYINKSVLFT